MAWIGKIIAKFWVQEGLFDGENVNYRSVIWSLLQLNDLVPYSYLMSRKFTYEQYYYDPVHILRSKARE